MDTSWATRPPDKGEYADYYHLYVGQVPAGNILDALDAGLKDSLALINAIPESRGSFRYAEGKWSIKEVLGHMIDTERVFTFRCLTFARGDQNALPSFEQDDYVTATDFNRRSLADLGSELAAVRSAGVHLFRSLSEDEMARRGVASGVEFSARSIPYIIAGHDIHHKQVLRERYLD